MHLVQSDENVSGQEPSPFSAADASLDIGGHEHDLFYSDGVSRPVKAIKVVVQINGQPVDMEVDTGASMMLISGQSYHMLTNVPSLAPAIDTTLRTYTGEVVPILGACEVTMNYEGNNAKLPVHVVRGKGPNLFGHDWLQVIKLDWPKILHVSCPGSSHYIPILRKHEHVFGEEGTFTTAKAKLFVDQRVLQSDTKRRFWKARPLAYALHAKVEKEHKRQEAAGVIEPIHYSEWAAPIVVTAKPDGGVRICDFLLTVNRFTRLDTS